MILFLLKYWNFEQVNSDVILAIDLFNYSNPSGALFSGLCCGSFVYSENCSIQAPKCDVQLKICIDRFDQG